MAVRPGEKWLKWQEENGWHAQNPDEPDPTARKISTSEGFVALCDKHGVKPTVRQARKYRRGYGSLRNAMRQATVETLG